MDVFKHFGCFSNFGESGSQLKNRRLVELYMVESQAKSKLSHKVDGLKLSNLGSK